jgi:hypothetical protein
MWGIPGVCSDVDSVIDPTIGMHLTPEDRVNMQFAHLYSLGFLEQNRGIILQRLHSDYKATVHELCRTLQ